MELLAAFLNGLRDRRPDAAAFVAQQGQQARRRAPRSSCGDVQERRHVQRGEDASTGPAITTTRGQTTCQGLIARFSCDIQ